MALSATFAICCSTDLEMKREMWLAMNTIRAVFVVSSRHTVSIKLDSIVIQDGVCSTADEDMWTKFGGPSI